MLKDTLTLPPHYLITENCLEDRAHFLRQLTDTLARGERLIQLRMKSLSEEAYKKLAQECLAITQTHGIAGISGFWGI